MSAPSDLYVGIMTGTSLDGVDCVVAAFTDKPNVIATYTQPIPSEIRKDLLHFATASQVDIEQLVRMHFVLPQLYTTAVEGCLSGAGIAPGSIRAIGLHGQTIRHLPKKVSFHADFPPVGATFQLGSGAALAALTGIDVVHDFRSADVALGGEGAPLVPMFDAKFLHRPDRDRIALNIGGIANITYLPKSQQGILAFDTGPGNMIIDAIADKYFNVSFDKDGALAAQGSVAEPVLDKLLSHHYFSLSPPKSTGRELFGSEFVGVLMRVMEKGDLEAGDALRTATELTARTVADAIRSVHPPAGTLEVIASGGGARNRFLMERIRELLGEQTEVTLSDDHGINVEAKEALAFAYFAKAFLDTEPIHLPKTTGASRQLLLGSLSKGT